MCPSRRPARGFTLVELLAVIAIIAILVTILVPYLGRAKELANQARCRGNQKVLVQAAMSYCDTWKVLCPAAWGPDPARPTEYLRVCEWYQKPMVGQYFGEDVPASGSVDGRSPPKKSVLRCPTPSVTYGPPDQSWIGYNVGMSFAYQPLGTNIRCMWRGPKLEEITMGASLFVLFADTPANSGFMYICDWSNNNDPTTMYNPWQRGSGAATDTLRHLGGINYGFLDGHVKYFPDPDNAYLKRQFFGSAGGSG